MKKLLVITWIIIIASCGNIADNSQEKDLDVMKTRTDTSRFFVFDLSNFTNTKILQSVNFAFNADSNIFYFRNNSWDTVLYMINCTSNTFDSTITPKFEKSSLVVYKNNLYVLNFVAPSVPNGVDSLTVYELSGKKYLKEFAFQYFNDKGYQEIDFCRKIDKSGLIACDVNNNLLYKIYPKSNPEIFSGIISLDSLFFEIKYYWRSDSLFIEDSLNRVSTFSKNNFDIDFNKKYYMFRRNGKTNLFGTSNNVSKLYNLPNINDHNLSLAYSVPIECYSASLKITETAAVWYCNKKLNIVYW